MSKSDNVYFSRRQSRSRPRSCTLRLRIQNSALSSLGAIAAEKLAKDRRTQRFQHIFFKIVEDEHSHIYRFLKLHSLFILKKYPNSHLLKQTCLTLTQHSIACKQIYRFRSGNSLSKLLRQITPPNIKMSL
jgi:hypothetical protein